jgi:hypothetical protein
MAALFSKPKIPDIPKAEPIPPTPTVDEAMTRQTEADRLNRRRGRASNILTGQGGVGAPASTAAKTLLGS